MGHRGDAIRVMREAQGLTRGQLAEIARVDRGHLGAVEAGKRQPTDRWAEKVKAALAANLSNIEGANS